MTATISTPQANYRQVRRVLLIVLAANLLVTVLKIALGIVTGALSVVADGFHSLVDSSSNLIGLAAINLARRPADEQHPYGYARYETIGSLAIGALMLVAAFEIGSAVFERFFSGGQPTLTLLTIGLLGLTFLVNLTVVILETRAGRKLNSSILLADAAHTRTDLFVTGTVLASLIGIWLGWNWLDPLVAAVVVVLILRAAFQILKDTAGVLADASILDAEQIEEIALGVPGVWYVHRVRSRGAPSAVYVDLHVKVYPGMSTDQAHAIATEVEQRIKKFYPDVNDVLVHIEPGKIDPLQLQGLDQNYQEYQHLAYELRKIADGLGLGIHDIHINRDSEAELDLEAHLEIQGDQTLQEAHDIAETFEQRVKEQWPEVNNVITHLEPIPEKIIFPEKDSRDEAFRKKINQFLDLQFNPDQILELHTHNLDGHQSVAVRLALPGTLGLVQAHEIAEELERDLLMEFHQLERVTVHLEPIQSLFPKNS